MTVLTILSPEEIKLFEEPPKFTAADRKAYFTLSKWAEEIIETLQSAEGKICFFLELGYFRATKKFYQPGAFREPDIVHAARRLSLPIPPGKLGSLPKATIHRHRTLIREKLGASAFSSAAEAILQREADLLLAKQLRLKDIFGELLAKLEQLKIEVPRYGDRAGSGVPHDGAPETGRDVGLLAHGGPRDGAGWVCRRVEA